MYYRATIFQIMPCKLKPECKQKEPCFCILKQRAEQEQEGQNSQKEKVNRFKNQFILEK
jgi:hypothetical protein